MVLGRRWARRLFGAALTAAMLSQLAVVGGVAAQPAAPAISSVVAGEGSLTVEWTAPDGAVASYDLRYIETGDDESVDANWTVEASVWSSGALQYTLGGLHGEVSYGVQMRAVNSQGAGVWSGTSEGTPRIGAPEISSVVVGDGALTVSWTGPAHAERATVASYGLRYIETAAADKTVDANWTTVEQAAWAAGLSLHVLQGLVNGTGYDVQVRAVTSSAGAWSATATGTPAEHGGTRADASVLAAGSYVGGSVDPGDDVDYFKLVLDAAVGVVIYTRGDLNTVGELQSSDGTRLAGNDNGMLVWGTRNFLIWDSLAAGTYYIKVTSHDGATGDYILRNLTIADSDSSVGKRQTIALGTALTGLRESSSDNDGYTFTLTQQTKVVVRGTSRIEGEILDSANNAVSGVESFDSLPYSGFVHRADLAAGTYNIDVSPVSESSDGLYTLYLLEAPDPGSMRDSAIPLAFYRAAVGTIDPTTDADYFRIETEEDTHVSVFASGIDVDVTAELLDSDGNTVDGAALRATTSGSEEGPLGFVLLHELAAGTHYLKVSRNLDGTGSATGPYAVLMREDFLYAEMIDTCESIPVSNDDIHDALYGCQWHLDNEGQRKGEAGEDANIGNVWATSMGSGVNVALVDDGFQSDHPDLVDNVDASRNYDYTGDGFYDPADSHGTGVAGLIAARDNSIGVRGVAPRATIYGYNFLQKPSLINAYDAMTRNMADTAVVNNSWGLAARPRPQAAGLLWRQGVESGITSGFGGKGVFYVFSAGNGVDAGDYSTLSELNSHYGVTSACAVNDLGRRSAYSEMGANLWVCAPSSDLDRSRAGIGTTDNLNRYRADSGGTSSAAPQVSGVAALMRAVNDSLSWRDVRLILAESARKNDPDNTGWETGALKLRSDPATPENYEFSHEYGFGVLDAEAAVGLARSWSNLPAMRQTGPLTSSRSLSIPTTGGLVSGSIQVESEIDFTEFVEVDATFHAFDFRNLLVELVSPSGAVSKLSVPETTRCPKVNPSPTGPELHCKWTSSIIFGSARHLGEDPSGAWTLRVQDRVHGGWNNRLNSWGITVYGHKATPGEPALDHVEPGADSLTVQWTAPGYGGSSDIAGYDVRHIRSDSGDKADDSAWTVVEDAAAAAVRSYTVSGLTDGLRRDVQVRAVNVRGGGDWSVTARGTPGTSNGEPFFVEGDAAARAVPEDLAAGMAVGAAVGARDHGSDTLTYSLGGSDAALFGVDSSTGQLRVKEPLNFEDAASHEVTVSVSDSKDDDGNADTAADASIAVTVTVVDVDEAPELTGDTDISHPENDRGTVAQFTAEDPEGGAVVWQFSGIDRNAFVFIGSRLEFVSAPDYESPADTDGRNDYEVVVTASDGVKERSLSVVVTVTDVNEPFTLTGDVAFDHDENDAAAVGTFTVDDPEDGAIVWSLRGVDGGDFAISGGRLSFVSVPDHEDPADSGSDNVYRVTVAAFDGANEQSRDVVVTVVDVDEPGAVALDRAQPQVGAVLTATLSDPDRGRSGVSWVWESSTGSSGPWSEVAGAGSRSYTPVGADVGRYLRVTAGYSDVHGSGKAVSAVTDNAVRAAPVVNTAPDFDAAVAARSVDENTAADTATGRPVGAPVTASDAENDILTYTLSGTDAALFDLDSRTGQLSTKTPLDHEARSGYSVTVTAADPSNETDSVAVSVTVNNVEEPGAVTLSSHFPTVGRRLTATVADPDGGVSGLSWQWRRSRSRSGGWTLIDGADANVYLPDDDDTGHYLQASASYTDRHEPQARDRAEAATAGTVSEAPDPDPDPDPPGPVRPIRAGPPGPPPAPVVDRNPAEEFFDLGDAGVHSETVLALASEGVLARTGCSRGRLCPNEPIRRWEMAVWLVRVLDGDDPGRPRRARFEDVSAGLWWAGHAERLARLRITLGCSTQPRLFCPDDPVTRAQMASFLVRAFDLAEADPAGFEDGSGTGHDAAIDALSAARITLGCSTEPRLFCPQRPTARDQVASFLIRAAEFRDTGRPSVAG